jgi:hypothetical protein
LSRGIKRDESTLLIPMKDSNGGAMLFRLSSLSPSPSLFLASLVPAAAQVSD